MAFKKRNLASKLWLKYTNKPGYKKYKWELKRYREQQFGDALVNSGHLNNIDKIVTATNGKGFLTVSHSGNAGDIIYALPTLKKIHEVTGLQIQLYFALNKPMLIPNYSAHPLGGVMLNQKMVDMLVPLIGKQSYIDSCGVLTTQVVDLDLDYFRAGLIPLDKGNIARWCGYVTGVTPDLWNSWLTVEPDNAYADSVVIARSARYQNYMLDYGFLNRYKNLVFLGVESEYLEIKKAIPAIKWEPVEDFFQMAGIIAGSKLFIGNQSFPYSIAEGLKVTRLLEVSFEVINVIPEGPGGHDFHFQEHFEWLVERYAGH